MEDESVYVDGQGNLQYTTYLEEEEHNKHALPEAPNMDPGKEPSDPQNGVNHPAFSQKTMKTQNPESVLPEGTLRTSVGEPQGAESSTTEVEPMQQPEKMLGRQLEKIRIVQTRKSRETGCAESRERSCTENREREAALKADKEAALKQRKKLY